jgi:P27 family predicted phage terminase small subunit
MGNPGKRTIPNSVQPSGKLTAPTQLAPAARIAWRKIVGAMPEGTYAATDAMTLATLCEAVADYWTAANMTTTQGRYVAGSTGQMVIAPWAKDKAELARLIYTLSQRLYLDPVARASLVTPPTTDDADPFEGLIQ